MPTTIIPSFTNHIETQQKREGLREKRERKMDTESLKKRGAEREERERERERENKISNFNFRTKLE